MTTHTADHTPHPTTNSRRRPRRLTIAATSVIVALTFASACSSGESSGDPPSAPSTPAPTVVVPPTQAPSALETQLTGILDTHRANHEFAGAVLALREADGTTLTVTSGTKDLSTGSDAVDPNVPWNIGSLTKTFVAVVVLQLADEGAIDLDAGIGTYFPELPALAPITPRQLLQHTSGLNEYWPSASVLQDAGRVWTPMEEIAVAEAAGRLDAPGASYHYSNTNYV
ncbi:MAG: class A beta-lactamase-related serine hydrolase, partial [Actinobacteria bacterium]